MVMMMEGDDDRVDGDDDGDDRDDGDGDLENHFLGRLIRSLGVPKGLEFSRSKKGQTFFFPPHSLRLCILPEDSLWINRSG